MPTFLDAIRLRLGAFTAIFQPSTMSADVTISAPIKSGTILVDADWAAPGAIGATIRSTIRGTTVDASGALTVGGNINAGGTSHVFGSTANTFNFVGINGSATSNRQILFQTAGSSRWNFFTNGAGGEPGGDGGSPFTLSYYTDGGAYKGDIFIANRLGTFTIIASTTRFTGANLGFFNATAIAKPTVTGSRSGGAALVSLLSALSSLGLITDTTTA